jgi:hypothetical protein
MNALPLFLLVVGIATVVMADMSACNSHPPLARTSCSQHAARLPAAAAAASLQCSSVQNPGFWATTLPAQRSHCTHAATSLEAETVLP